MSARKPLDTSKFKITAENFKDELDSVLEYVQLASARQDLPTLEELFIEPDTNRYWLLCYSIRFAATCATQRVENIAREIADEMVDPEACRISAYGRAASVADRLRELDRLDYVP